jgi:tetrahydrodipicolinate N-succinyltransferase
MCRLARALVLFRRVVKTVDAQTRAKTGINELLRE